MAISDVSAYVSRGTPLDDEARRRGTSVYFPRTGFSDAPRGVIKWHLLSCSPEKDRLSLVVDIKITLDGRIQSFTFYEAIIRSQSKATYEEVQQLYR